MKNIIIYNKVNVSSNGGKINDFIIEKYLKAQVENSLYYGWNPNDIVIATNFPFEHMGIKNTLLKDVCDWNGFNNKWYGIKEIFQNHFKEECWLHDYDNWQISPIEFPQFNGKISGCTYVFTEEWNTSSLFFKKDCENILDYIYEFIKLNKHIHFDSDENAVAVLRKVPEVQNYFSTIDNKYNVGLTKLEHRYNAATKPVCTLGVKILNKGSYENFIKKYMNFNLIPNHLDDIIQKYKE